ncbi:MAG: DUF1284 domain-containing protein [Candidatus Omnitrophica bacterium]|nr:DUF1284 domain-containing protein [Candidatus Omnitrophota bacterium]MCM8825561.1 DUF1284 domain-containing protein [Candidatus Omnitrophota bacterium]
MKDLLKIRPHHLFCLLGFKGIGYSETFVKNMDKILNMIKEDPELKVNLVMGGDDICAFCPYFSNMKCVKKSDSEIILRDKERRIISIMDVDIPSSAKLSELYKKIRDRFAVDMLDNLCKDCQWYSMGDCKTGLRMLKRGEYL